MEVKEVACGARATVVCALTGSRGTPCPLPVDNRSLDSLGEFILV